MCPPPTTPRREPLSADETARLLERSSDGIFTIDFDGRVRTWNAGAEQLYGWTEEQAVGRISRELLCTRFPSPRESIVAQVRAAGSWSGELTHRRRDGETVSVNSRWLLMRDERQQPMAIMELNTALAKAELATRASEAKFRSLLEAAPDAIVIANAEGLIEIANWRVYDLFGYRSEELAGMPVEVLMPGRFADVHTRHRAQFVQSPQTREMGVGLELRARHKSGQEFPVEISLSPLRVGGEFLVTAVIRDISQRKQAEAAEKRLHTLQLAAAEHLATLGEVAAGLAHEIKNPLAGIAGALEVLAPRFPAAEDREIAAEVQQQVGRIKRAVEDLLHYARPRPLQLIPADLNETVTGVVHFAEHGLPPSVRVEFVPGALPPLVHDPDQIRQLILNLLLNAAEAMGGEGRIEIWSEASAAPEARVRVHVRDHGPGITAADLDRIFRPFYTTKEGKGNGLGLPLSRRIAELHSGTLTVISQPGAGATFTLTLPAPPPPWSVSVNQP